MWDKKREGFLLVGSDLNSFSPFVSFRGCLRVIPFFVLIYKGAFIAYRIFVKIGNENIVIYTFWKHYWFNITRKNTAYSFDLIDNPEGLEECL